MLAFAAFVPHPLISLPEIGKEHVAKVRHTIRAYRTLAQELYAAKPDTIFVITPHGERVDGAWTINQQPRLSLDFSAYGDLSDRLIFINDIGFGYRIKESVETTMPVSLVDAATLDYGSAIPLFHLTKRIPHETVQVAIAGISAASVADHVKFGNAINRQINLTTKRIAVIASGDLAHGSSRFGVAPYSHDAFVFNKKIRTVFETNNLRELRDLGAQPHGGIAECATRVLAVALGIIGERACTPHVLAYEAAIGVGYLTVRFDFR